METYETDDNYQDGGDYDDSYEYVEDDPQADLRQDVSDLQNWRQEREADQDQEGFEYSDSDGFIGDYTDEDGDLRPEVHDYVQSQLDAISQQRGSPLSLDEQQILGNEALVQPDERGLPDVAGVYKTYTELLDSKEGRREWMNMRLGGAPSYSSKRSGQ